MRVSRIITAFALLCVGMKIAVAHPPPTNLPPTKAGADLKKARDLMDTAKQKLADQGRYNCCLKAPAGGISRSRERVAGCDTCAIKNGSCKCGINLSEGKGVCGDCLGGWKAGMGAIPGIDPKSVKLLASPNQKMDDDPAQPVPPELAQARTLMNTAKKTLVAEGRYACCIGKGGCDMCAYETHCPCGQEASEGADGGGICGQCYDGWFAGIGRLAGLTAQNMKMEPMQGMTMGHGAGTDASHGQMHEDDMMAMHGMAPIAGIAETQQASGTSWMPSDSPMYAIHGKAGGWNTMFHYNAFLTYDQQNGKRGDHQINSTNWAMLMASRPVGAGGKDTLQLRSMVSLEPITTTEAGYPLLYQSGEQYRGKPLVDRQHPHDLFMELSAKYTHPTGKDSAAFLYVAPSGEPALGPTAFMHRTSALDNPLPPISHHWQDSTHIEFGVLTVGAWKRKLQIEGSYFTGREPDENRYDLSPFHPDSFSGRLSFNPNKNWSLQVSQGFLHSPEALRPTENTRRSTASASYTILRQGGGFWATTFVYGKNETNHVGSDSYLLESELNLSEKNMLFGRYEYVRKLGEELDVSPLDRKYGIQKMTLGYSRTIGGNQSLQTAVGAAVTFNHAPADLSPLYGNSPMGFALFLRIRPGNMHYGGSMGGDTMHGMSGM